MNETYIISSIKHNYPLLRWLVGFACMSLDEYIHLWTQEVTFNIAYEFNGIPSVEPVVHTQEKPLLELNPKFVFVLFVF